MKASSKQLGANALPRMAFHNIIYYFAFKEGARESFLFSILMNFLEALAKLVDKLNNQLGSIINILMFVQYTLFVIQQTFSVILI